MKKKKGILNFILLAFLAIMFVAPIVIIFYNSFKGKLYISDDPFSFPNSITFVGIQNYISGVAKTGFFKAFALSLFVTVLSTLVIVFFASMAAWYIVRRKTKFTKALYFLFVFSMIVPFQMIMFTMSKVANLIHLDNPIGLIILYLGFGAGMAVFMFSGFIKSVPIEMEEAAMIDGCTPIQTFFLIVLPMLKPIAITISILDAMWIWNDYLLPYLVIGRDYKTIPIVIQYLRGGYGSIDMGSMMALLVLAIIPIIIFYLVCQKYIIKGVTSGAVKG